MTGEAVSEHRRAQLWAWMSGVGLALLYAAFVVRNRFVDLDGKLSFSLFDDAMISMRYARNLAEGAGLQWNAGGPHVEGYSNLLWTLWMSFLHLWPVPLRLMSLLVCGSSAALLGLNLVIVWILVRRMEGRPATAAIAVAFSALSYPLIYWSLRGMEVALLVALLDAALLLTLRLADRASPRNGWLLGLTLALLVLTRDETSVPAAVVVGFLILDRRTRRAAVPAGLCLFGALAGHLLFRLLYYGAPFPNTYYLKLTGVELGVRLARGIPVDVRLLTTVLLVPVALAGVALFDRPRDRGRWLLATIVLGQFAYSAYVGADAWESMGYANRYLSVSLPALGVLAALGAEGLWVGEGSLRVRAVVAVAILLRIVAFAIGDFVPDWQSSPPVNLHVNVERWRDAATLPLCALMLALGSSLLIRRIPTRWWALGVLLLVSCFAADWVGWWHNGADSVHGDAAHARLGMLAAKTLAPGTSIAVVWAGAIPYFSGLPTIDLMGKSDVHVAHEPPRGKFLPGHNKWDNSYSIGELHPDVILELWDRNNLQPLRDGGYQMLPSGFFVRPNVAGDLAALGSWRERMTGRRPQRFDRRRGR